MSSVAGLQRRWWWSAAVYSTSQQTTLPHAWNFYVTLSELAFERKPRGVFFVVFLDGPGNSLTPRERLNSRRSVLTWTQELYQKRKGNGNAAFCRTPLRAVLSHSCADSCCIVLGESTCIIDAVLWLYFKVNPVSSTKWASC